MLLLPYFGVAILRIALSMVTLHSHIVNLYLWQDLGIFFYFA